MDDKIMNFKEAMAFLKIPRSTLYKLVQENRVPAVKVGRHWRFSKKTLEKWISADEVESGSHRTMGPNDEKRIYCWQASKSKPAQEHGCTTCLTYRVRAMNCFLLRSEVDASLVQCSTPCRECDYFIENFN